MPTVPATGVIYPTSFGAKGDGVTDDTDAIQRAINALQPGQWLVFPPGTYVHSRSLWIKTPNTTLWSSGATLYATNPSDQAILLAADGVAVYNFTLYAVTSGRRSAPWESRIAIFSDVNNAYPTHNNIVRQNRILAGDVGSPTTNGASAAGIYIYHAENFLVAENTVQRSLSDGIHMTGGSSDGRVIGNFVHQTGDDLISIVSYLGDGWTQTSAQSEADTFAARADRNLVRNVVIASNEVGGNYWGRGVSVVGGHDVTIRNNLIEDTTMAAGVYLAREQSYTSFGVRNVLVQNNTINRVQVNDPVYAPNGIPAKTWQAAIEMYSNVFDDELQIPILQDELRVEHVQVQGNVIDTTFQSAVRAGWGSGVHSVMQGTSASGVSMTRGYWGVDVGPLSVFNNNMTRIGGTPAMRLLGSAASAVTYCSNNTLGGITTTSALCAPSATQSSVVVGGASLSCGV